MYFLYISSIGFILYSFYKYVMNNYINKTTILNNFDDKTKYKFLLKNIEFYVNNKCIEVKEYNMYYTKQASLNISNTYIFDYCIINYNYNDKLYKYVSEINYIKFPIYSEEELKNYVYINQIKKAILEYNYNENELKTKNENINENEKESEKIDILKYLLPFLGPNYNFYKETNNKMNLKYIINSMNYEIGMDKDLDKVSNFYLLNNIINKVYKLKLYDTFNNEYDVVCDDLKWNPNLVM